MSTVLVSIDPKQNICRRYEVKRGVRRMTHGYAFEVPVTAERVEDIRTQPDETGVPEPEVA